MSEPVLLADKDDRGVLRLTLNRPEVHNAYNEELLRSMIEELGKRSSDESIRVVILQSEGKHFQAGADLSYLRKSADYSREEMLEASALSCRVMKNLTEFPALTLALVNGACYGGGCGLVACCDVAVASEDAQFGLTEVRVGVIPAPITHYLNSSMGERWVRRYGLTAESFGADQALLSGLVQEVVPRDQLRAKGEEIVEETLKNDPEAVRAFKHMTLETSGLILEEEEVDRLTREAAEKRSSDAAREGLEAYLEDRSPAWAP